MDTEKRKLDDVNFILFADYLGYTSELVNEAESVYYYREHLDKIQKAMFHIEAVYLLHTILNDISLHDLKDLLSNYYDFLEMMGYNDNLPF